MISRSGLVALIAIALAIVSNWAAATPQDAMKFLGGGRTGLAQFVGLPDADKGQLRELAKEVSAKTGGKVYFVVHKSDESPDAYGALYEQLGMSGKDILVASNGQKWEVKVAALSHEAKQAAVNRALPSTVGAAPPQRFKAVTGELEVALSQTQGKKLTWNEFQSANAGKGWDGHRMSREYETYKATGHTSGGAIATVGHSTPITHSSSSSGWGTWAFLGVVVAAIVGIVLWRRRKRDGDLGAELKQMLQHPESTLADVVMNMDGLENHPRFGQLMDAYSACENKLKDLKNGAPTREAVSKARALNDEANRVRRMFDEAKMGR